MNIKSAAALISIAIALPSLARAGGKTCVRYAVGVPRISEPPAWADGMDVPKDISLDDPRWNEAEAKTLGGASATTPMTVRSLWWQNSEAPPKKYLYLSFVSDMWPDAATARDIFVGFHRTDAGAPDPGYIFQFHLEGVDSLGAAPMSFCGKYNSTFGCDSGATAWWRVFVDSGANTSCDMLTSAHQFKAAGTSAASAPWIATNVRAWQTWNTEVDKRKWAVQIRVPIVAAGSPLSAGIPEGATYWYESTGNPVAPASIARWPLDVTTSVCKKALDPANDQLVHAQLGDASKYSALALLPRGGTDDTCDKGLRLDRDHIGSVFASSGPFDSATLTRSIKSGGKNTLVAQVQNDAAPFTGSLTARFRIADWGSTAGSAGEWNDVPGQTTPPTATPVSIPTGGQKAITLDWTLSKTDICKYQLNANPADCLDCACGPTGSPGCPAGQVGKKSTDNETCVALHAQHQCMYVEIGSPNGGAQFSQKSAYNNMNFGTMSKFEQNATIDVGGIPPEADGTHEVLLFVRPHNMPRTTKRPTTGILFVGNNALAEAERIATAHQSIVARLPQAELKKAFQLRGKVTTSNLGAGMKVLGSSSAVRFENARRALDAGTNRTADRFLSIAQKGVKDARKTTGADAMTRQLVGQLGPRAASKLVPTLEIYPYYKSTSSKTYQPMEAFSVFLSHDGALGGFTWELSGAGVTRVKDNVYKVVVPKNTKRAGVVVRSETVPATLPQGPVSLEWSKSWGPAANDQ